LWFFPELVNLTDFSEGTETLTSLPSFPDFGRSNITLLLLGFLSFESAAELIRRRKTVCEVVFGGERAILLRYKRYQLTAIFKILKRIPN